MKPAILIICTMVLSTSCVTKARYNEVVANIQTREKQQKKLEKKLEELKKTNEVLSDSADRMR